jgi:hypothetical protein
LRFELFDINRIKLSALPLDATADKDEGNLSGIDMMR